jgi:Uma2 family endonuclease
MSMPLTSHFTAEAVRALPDDGNRYETVHGELLVTPAPDGKHQYVLGNLQAMIHNYLAANGIDGALAAPADISFGLDDILVQPDLFVADLAAFKRGWKWARIRTLHLAIEVVSPSSAKADRGLKRRLYQAQGVAEYWAVDLDRRQVEVWTPDARFPRVERERLIWRHPLLDESCILDLARLLSD